MYACRILVCCNNIEEGEGRAKDEEQRDMMLTVVLFSTALVKRVR